MNKLKMLCAKIWQRLNWQANWVTYLEFGLVAAIIPAMRWANPQWFVEDGLAENIQLLVLAIAVIIALRAKNSPSLFTFAALVLIFMIMRETNMFRGYFCTKYLSTGDVCRWSEFKYGWIAPGLRWAFVIFAAGYFVLRKLWRPLWNYILKAPIFVWDLLILAVMIVGGTIAEFACIDNEILEECCELAAYTALVNCVWRYANWQA